MSNTNIGTWTSGWGRDLNVCETYIKQIKFLVARHDLAGAVALYNTLMTDLTTLQGQLSTANGANLVSNLPNTPTLPDPILYPELPSY